MASRRLLLPPGGGPVRTCVGCRRRAAKRELLRVTAGSDAEGRPVAVPDPRGTEPGRGAHLHPDPACFDLAVRRKALARALRVPGLDPAPLAEHLGPHAAPSSDTSSTSDTQHRP